MTGIEPTYDYNFLATDIIKWEFLRYKRINNYNYVFCYVNATHSFRGFHLVHRAWA